MSKKFGIIVAILSIAALCLSAFAIIQVKDANASIKGEIQDVQEALKAREAQEAQEAKEDQNSTDVQYVMYLGTNDKDSNEPVFTPEEAKDEAEKILLKHFGGYTIQQADGGWIDGETVYTEYTLVIYLSDTNRESVHAAADEMIEKFHQSSVLIQENQTTTEFYAGEQDQTNRMQCQA